MQMTPVLAFAIVAAAFGVGDIIAKKTKGYVSSVLSAVLLFILFGGVFKLLPADLMEQSGLSALIPTFGMALILVNVGSMLDINDLRAEWKTVLVSLTGVGAVLLIGFTIAPLLFGREFSLAAIPTTTGGIAATMMMTTAAAEAGQADLGAVAASVMALQMLVGLPISSLALRREADRFLCASPLTADKDITPLNLRLLPPTPESLDIPTIHFARLAIAGVVAQLITQFTGISTGVTFLVVGILFAALGLIEKGSLKTAGGEGLLMLATYASITASFVGMTLQQFGAILFPVIGFLLLCAAAICLLTSLVGKLLGFSPLLSIPIGLSCMFGYPVTYAIAMEVSAGAAKDRENPAGDEENLIAYLLPKMMVAGAVSVSIASVVIAGLIIPILFG